MKTMLITLVFCCVSSILIGQNNAVKIKKNKKGIIEYVKFPKSEKVKIPETSSKNTLKQLLLTILD